MSTSVPMLVYFDNGLGSDLVAKGKGLSLEIVVPPATALGAKENLVTARTQLQRAEDEFAVDRLWDASLPHAAELSALVETWRGEHATFVAFQAREPTLAAPLGWVLSDTSVCGMEKSLGAGKQAKDFGFGKLTDLTHNAFGATYVGVEPSHCNGS